MNTTNEATQSARAKDEFFSADMHMFHVTGFPQQPGVLTSKAAAPRDARLDMWPTDPASNHHISGPDAGRAAFGTEGFSAHQQRQPDPARPEEILEDNRRERRR